MHLITPLLAASLLILVTPSIVWPADPEVLRPRVPSEQMDGARQMTNPYATTREIIEQGKTLFEGKAFCRACHGSDGKGLGTDIEPGSLKGPLPRNFTDKDWQAARTDGELFWILKNGSKGTAMAPFIPLVLTEEEAWKVITYVRSFVRP
jgi:mono/diheme cytochrome c family protein